MVRKERKGAAAWIVLDRPEVRNALSTELTLAARAALEEAVADDSVRSIVITGAGSAFSAGADLNEMKSMRDASFEANVENALRIGDLFAAVAAAPKPVVARVNGPALAGALGLVCACDVSIAVSGISFAFTESRIGLAPAMISPWVMRRVGPARAQRLFLTGERVTAEEAERLGLLDRVVAPEKLDETVESLCADFVKCAPGAMARVKEIVAHVMVGAPESHRRYTAEHLAHMRAGEEGQEGMASFLEKRPPRWARE